jgi:hypothetical protein
LLCLPHSRAARFSFFLSFSFCRPLFHFYLLYFFVTLPSCLCSLTRSFFSFVCVFHFFLYFHVLPLSICFLFIFFCPCPLPCSVPLPVTFFPLCGLFKTFGLGHIEPESNFLGCRNSSHKGPEKLIIRFKIT